MFGVIKLFQSTASDRFSGHGYSGNDRFSGTKPSDNAIIFTNSGITIIVELFDSDPSQVRILKHIKMQKPSFIFKQVQLRWT